MRSTNRGDVPAPHIPLNVGKNYLNAGDEIVFDSGALSYVKGWVEGGEEVVADAKAESKRNDPGLSNPNKRLGVGAKPKKAKRDQPEPTALQKKLARKHRREEIADAIAGDVGTHGVAEGDIESEGESKTASFKRKKKEPRIDRAAGERPAKITVDKQTERELGKKVVKVKEDDEGIGNNEHLKSEKRISNRKTRRNKINSRGAGGDGGGDAAVSEPQQAAAENANASVEEPLTKEQEPSDECADSRHPGTRKERRGWGKTRPKPPAAPADNDSRSRDGEDASFTRAVPEDRRSEWPKRKKVRSRQKNIRKDKRPLEQRPAYLRIGDPEFSGRGLTPETRNVLGLPPDYIDAASADWGKHGNEVGWVVDKKPREVPKHLVGNKEDAPVAVERVGSKDHRVGVSGAQSSRKPKSKYKNLA